jgi:hypothetical protein
METPNRFIIVKIGDFYKVFATYLGGYLYGDSWKLNSGIQKVTEDNDFYYFYGYSGSVYKCHKNSYGTSNFTQSILDNIIEKGISQGIDIKILDSNTNFINLLD